MRLSVIAACLSCCLIGFSAADDAHASIAKETNIPAEGLGPALNTLAKDRNFQIVYVTEEIAHVRTGGAVGEFTTDEALKQLLTGTGLTYWYLDDKTVTIGSGLASHQRSDRVSSGSLSGASDDANPKEGKKSSSDEFRVAQVDQGKSPSASSIANQTVNSQEISEGASTGLAEIIVTAQKRSENLRDVPASISALTSDDIAAQHIDSAEDVTRAVPGISFNAQSGNGTTVGVGSQNIVIRGIGSAVGSATVSLYMDEVPVTQLIQAGTFVPKPFDLDRVEVLRGPQGTLYGASSEGGTVRFITKQPDLHELVGYVSGNLSHTQHGGYNTDGQAVVNLPIIDNVLAVRAGVEITENSGWIDRYANVPGTLFTPTTLLRRGVNSERDVVARLTLKYQPDPTLSITPAVMYQREYQDDSPAYYLDEGQFQQSKSVAEWARDSGLIPSLTIEKSFEFTDLTSVTGHVSRHFDRAKDGTFFDSNYVVPSFLDTDPRTAAEQPIADQTLAVLPVTVVDRDRVTSFNQEIRLASPAGDGSPRRLNWVVGAYFADDVDDTVHDELAPGWNALFAQIYGFSVNDPLRSPLADPTGPTLWQNNFLSFATRNEVKQTAVFGQIDYKIVPRLRASAGLRYQISDLSFSYNGKGYYDIGIANVSGLHSKDVALTPKFSLSYELDSTANVYVSAAKGYRDGGFNSPPVPQVLCGPDEQLIGLKGPIPSSYVPDQLWSYELGFKALLADSRLSINAGVYDIRWSRIQQQIVIPVCAFDFTANVGAAEAYGTELEVVYKVPIVTGVTLSASASKEHATITSTSANSGAAVGDKLLFTPDFTATASVTYTRPVNQSLSAFLRVDNYWQGRSYGEFTPGLTDSINRQYEVMNASFGVRSAGGLEVEVFAKNLLNNTTVIREPTIAAVTQAYTLPPRIIGLKAMKRF